MEKLNEQEAAKLHKGECPDCGGTRILSGPKGPGSENVVCANCKMKFNLAVGMLDGQRLGKQTDPIISDPVTIPGNGYLVEKIDGKFKYILHSCQNINHYGHPCKWEKEFRGCVDIVQVSENTCFLHCRSCNMRISVSSEVRTWEDIVKLYG